MLQHPDPRTSPEVVRALLDGRHDPTNPAIGFVQVMLSGFGYDFTNPKNRARANDNLVRTRAAALLGDAAKAIAKLENDFRASDVPPASREQPFPPAGVMAALRAVDVLRRRVEGLSSTVLTLEAPALDRVWARLQNEQELLERLLAVDIGLIVRAHDVVDATATLGVDAVRNRQLTPVEAPLAECDHAIADRRSLFSILL